MEKKVDLNVRASTYYLDDADSNPGRVRVLGGLKEKN